MEYVKLKEIASIVTGGTPSTSKKEYWENGTIPWLQSGCCQNCNVNSSSSFITQEGYDNSVTKLMPKDTILIALTGATAGKVGYLTFEACGNQSITGITLNEDNLPKFLFYYLLYLRPKILRDCVGGAQPHISQGYVKEIDYPSLSKNKQQEIVSILGAINNIIDADKKQLELLDEAVKSRFIEMFGECDNKIRLEELSTLITKGASPKWQGIEYVDDGVLFVTSENVREGFIDISNPKYLEEKVNIKQPRSILKRGDVLINIVGASIGRAAIYDYDLLANINQAVSLVRPNDKVNIKYLITFLNSENAMMQYKNNAKGGARDNLSLKNISDLIIPFPDMIKQNEFASFVEIIDKSKFNVQQHLNLMQELLDKKMDEFFGGKE